MSGTSLGSVDWGDGRLSFRSLAQLGDGRLVLEVAAPRRSVSWPSVGRLYRLEVACGSASQVWPHARFEEAYPYRPNPDTTLYRLTWTPVDVRPLVAAPSSPEEVPT